jgi:FG-GAP-like repeat
MASSRKAVVSLVALAVCLLVAGGLTWRSRNRAAEETAAAEANAKAKRFRDTRDTLHLIDLKNGALADLENGNYVGADPVLLNLATEGSHEHLGRDWIIGRLLEIGTLDLKRNPTAYDESVERAQTAQNLEEALEPKTAIRHYLAGKLAEARGLAKARVFEQHIAAGTSPGDPVQWAELYRAQVASGTPADRADSEGTLKSLVILVPDNLYALLEWLTVQIRQKAPKIDETLSRLEGQLLPIFADQPADQARQFADLIKETRASAQAANWSAVAAGVAALDKLVRPLPEVEADRRRIERDLSWHIVSDYSYAYYQKHHIERRLESAGKPVHFREVPLSGSLAEIADAREARFVEFDPESAGRLDVAVLRGAAFEIFSRDPHSEPGGPWVKAASVPLPHGSYVHFVPVELGDGLEAGDRRSVDFILFGPAGVLVLENRVEAGGHARTLRPLRSAPLADGTKDAESVVALDLDGDGLNDLVVACRSPNSAGATLRVWRNQGNKTFRDITSRSGLLGVPVGGPLVAVDWDNDLDVDLLAPGAAGLAAGSPGVAFLKGRGLARFRPQPLLTKDSDVQSATALTVLDADSNGSWDLLASGPHGTFLLLTSSIEHGLRETIGVEAVSDFAAEGTLVFDYDNDGSPDFIAWNKEAVRCFHGSSEGHFEAADDVFPAGLGAIASADFGDLDQDGDSDLLVVKAGPANQAGRLAILQNDGGNANNWIDVRLDNRPANGKAAGQARVPPRGRGATVCLKVRSALQSQMAVKPVTHFGLGSLDSAQVLRVLWNTGVPVNVLQPAKNTTIIQTPPTRVP